MPFDSVQGTHFSFTTSFTIGINPMGSSRIAQFKEYKKTSKRGLDGGPVIFMLDLRRFTLSLQIHNNQKRMCALIDSHAD